MPQDAGDIDIHALAEASAIVGHGGVKCWASYVADEEVLAYLELIQQRLDEGLPTNKNKVRRDLEEHWGIRLHRDTLNRHLRKECRCHE